MKLIKATLMMAGAAAISANASATENKMYMGIGWGQASIDTGVSGVTGTATLDEDDNGLSIFGGYEVSKNIDIEVHYSDFGEASLKGNNGDTFVHSKTTYTFTSNNVTLTSKGTSFGVSGVFSQSINDQAAVYGKLGIHKWDTKVTSSANNNWSLSDDGTDLFYGIGLGYKITGQTAIRADLSRFNFDNDHVDYVGIGLTQSF